MSVGGIYSTVNWGAILAPVIAGMLADRFFPAQIVMAVLHLLGAAILWRISTITDPTTFFWTLLLYSICFMPTLGLANAVSFHQMSDPARQFPGVRVMGSIGWIVVGLLVGYGAPAGPGSLHREHQSAAALRALLSLAMGLYCLTLPHYATRQCRQAAVAVSGLGTGNPGLHEGSILRDFHPRIAC